jgi:hypothetical protein
VASCPAGTVLVMSTPANRAAPVSEACYYVAEEYTVDINAGAETSTLADGVRKWKGTNLHGNAKAGTYAAGTIVINNTAKRILLPTEYGAWSNRTFGTSYTLPSIEILGSSVAGDVLFVGPSPTAIPCISPSLTLGDGAKLLGRVRTAKSNVVFGALSCTGGSFVDSGSTIKVAAAFSDTSFGAVTFPDAGVVLEVEKSALLADVESVATSITVKECTMGNLSNVGYGVAPTKFGLTGSRCKAVKLRLEDLTAQFPTSAGQHKVESCILGSYMFLGKASEVTEILDTEIQGALALWDPEGPMPPEDGSGVTAMIMSNVPGCCRIGSVRLETVCTIAVTGGRLDIGSVTDGRVDTANWTDTSRGKSVLLGIESTINIGRMTLLGMLDFPCSAGCLDGGVLNIGVLDLLAAGSAGFGLDLSCTGVNARSVIDRNGLAKALTIVKGSIGEFCVPETNAQQLSLHCTDSRVKIVCRIPTDGATVGVDLMQSRGSLVDVSGRTVTNVGQADSVDNTSALIVANGSLISYASDSARILVPGKRFEDLIVAYPNPETPTGALEITFPDPTVAADAAVSQLLRYAYAYNKSRSVITAQGHIATTDKDYKIQPEMYRNMASPGTLPRLSFNDAMFS